AAGRGAARGTGAAAGRGGMGMAPVGHGGHGHSSPKDKRDQTGQESLYTEDRAWTEALIGGHEPDETADHAPVTASPPEIDQQLAAALRAAALREALGY
ncbi:hypothetical protein OSJ81_20750, partial [Mycobacterium ulcerans]